jgi:mRNA-degrading endonuclease toxin of MazEF toxin-antitoxin module
MPKRGDVFWIEIPQKDTVGHEEYGLRPWLVVSDDIIPAQEDLLIAVPLTTGKRANLQFRIEIPDSEKINEAGTKGWSGFSVALTEQVRVLDLTRLGYNPVKVGHVKPLGMNRVEAGLLFVLGIPI